MMKPTSIRQRLIKMQLMLTVLILVLSSGLFTVNNLVVFRRSVVRNLASMAGILGRNLLPALAFSDKNEANKVLSSLQTEPGITHAYVMTGDPVPFAHYGELKDPVPEIPKMDADENVQSRLEGLNLIFFHKLRQGPDVLGTLVLRSDLKIFAIEYRGYIWILLGVFGVGFVVAMLVSQVVQRNLADPISELARTAETVSMSSDYTIRMAPKEMRQPIQEVDSLAKDFNTMLDQIQRRDMEILAANQDLERKIEKRTAELREAQKSAVENAHAAGMAEIATGILHNIGNIVNSINTSVDEIRRAVQESRVGGLLKANQMLEENMGNLEHFFKDDPKGKLLPEYYLQLGHALKDENGKVEKETESLVKKVILIRDVIMTQQEYAKRGLNVEEMSLVQIVEEVLELQRAMLARHEIRVVKNYKDSAPVRIQRVKFAHILMNLIKNAKEAMEQTEPEKRVLVVETGFSEELGHYLKISDTGEGIATENMKRMFNHGFTTKTNGHGFGLHFCANAMTEMGGKLMTESEGKGKGATFTLSFGVQQAQQGADKERYHA